MKQFLFILIVLSLFSCIKENKKDSDNYPLESNSDSKLINIDDETPSFVDAQGKKDWLLTRLNEPQTSTKELFDVYGVDGFGELKSKEEYWKDPKTREKFVNEYGSQARGYFDDMYDEYKNEFTDFKNGIVKRAPTGYELIKDDVSKLRSSLKLRY